MFACVYVGLSTHSDAGPAPSKTKYATWLQHHGDHMPQKKPSSEAANTASSVKQLLTKLEYSLSNQAAELKLNKQEDDKASVKDGVDAQNGDNSQEKSDLPTEPPTVTPLQRLLSMRERHRVLRDVGTSMFDAEWSVIQRNIDNEEMKNFSAFIYGNHFLV